MNISLESFFTYLDKYQGVRIPEDLVKETKQPFYSLVEARKFLLGTKDRLIKQIPADQHEQILEINTIFKFKADLMRKENPLATDLKELRYNGFFFEKTDINYLSDFFLTSEKMESLTLSTLKKFTSEPEVISLLKNKGIQLPQEINQENFKVVAAFIQSEIEENAPESDSLKKSLEKAFKAAQYDLPAKNDKEFVKEGIFRSLGSFFIIDEKLENLSFLTLKKLASDPQTVGIMKEVSIDLPEEITRQNTKPTVKLIQTKIEAKIPEKSQALEDSWEKAWRSAQSDLVTQNCIKEFQTTVQFPNFKAVALKKGVSIPPEITRENILQLNDALRNTFGNWRKMPMVVEVLLGPGGLLENTTIG